MIPTVVIEVNGGVVQCVYSDRAVVAIIIDHDDERAAEEKRIELRRSGMAEDHISQEVDDLVVGQLGVDDLETLAEPYRQRALALSADSSVRS